jgi:hypothetical protein
VQFRSEGAILEERAAFFGGEHAVDKNLGERLRHEGSMQGEPY